MPPVVIENPVLNSPFRKPARHLRFDDDGIGDEIPDGRRPTSFVGRIASGRAGQRRFDSECRDTLTRGRLTPENHSDELARGLASGNWGPM